MKHIVSSIPGRARLRDPRLRDPRRLERLRHALTALPGVLSVDGNLKAGSLVVRYDAARQAPGRFDVDIEAAAASELAKPAPKGRQLTRVALNRHAKRGMLASLAVSMLFAAAGRKRWHVASGGVFLACLMVHLAVHRRHLLR